MGVSGGGTNDHPEYEVDAGLEKHRHDIWPRKASLSGTSGPEPSRTVAA